MPEYVYNIDASFAMFVNDNILLMVFVDTPNVIYGIKLDQKRNHYIFGADTPQRRARGFISARCVRYIPNMETTVSETTYNQLLASHYEHIATEYRDRLRETTFWWSLFNPNAELFPGIECSTKCMSNVPIKDQTKWLVFFRSGDCFLLGWTTRLRTYQLVFGQQTKKKVQGWIEDGRKIETLRRGKKFIVSIIQSDDIPGDSVSVKFAPHSYTANHRANYYFYWSLYSAVAEHLMVELD